MALGQSLGQSTIIPPRNEEFSDLVTTSSSEFSDDDDAMSNMGCIVVMPPFLSGFLGSVPIERGYLRYGWYFGGAVH